MSQEPPHAPLNINHSAPAQAPASSTTRGEASDGPANRHRRRLSPEKRALSALERKAYRRAPRQRPATPSLLLTRSGAHTTWLDRQAPFVCRFRTTYGVTCGAQSLGPSVQVSK